MNVPASIPARLHDLYLVAAKGQKNSFAPYSKFQVGAAIRLRDGRIFGGGNIEFVVNGLSVCAERGVLQAVMSELGRVEMAEVFVLTNGVPAVFPCGGCRQALAEFAPKDMSLPIHAANPQGDFKTTTLAALLPMTYTPDYVPH